MLRWNIVTFERKNSIYMKRTDTVLDALLLLKFFPPPYREVYWNCHTDSQCATVNFMIDRDRDRNVNNIIHFKCSDPALDEGAAGTVTWTHGSLTRNSSLAYHWSTNRWKYIFSLQLSVYILYHKKCKTTWKRKSLWSTDRWHPTQILRTNNGICYLDNITAAVWQLKSNWCLAFFHITLEADIF